MPCKPCPPHPFFLCPLKFHPLDNINQVHLAFFIFADTDYEADAHETGNESGHHPSKKDKKICGRGKPLPSNKRMKKQNKGRNLSYL